jgi:hypothetical protein
MNMGCHIRLIFLLVFLASFFFDWTGITVSSSHDVKQLLQIVFDKHSGDGAICTKQVPSVVK